MKKILLLVLLIIVACSQQTPQATNSPEDVVRKYFVAWGEKDYKTMYAQISDGFKKIDPQAKDIDTFSKYMDQYYVQAKGIKLLDVKEISNNGKEAVVEYKILMQLNGGDKEFSDKYTLKLKENGWKLIHPYGDNIDVE